MRPKAGREVLLKAADLLEKSEWWRGGDSHTCRQKNEHCPLTAMAAIAPDLVDLPVISEARRYLNEAIAGPNIVASNIIIHIIHYIIHYNDTVAKNKEEVVNKMREAAKR